MAGQAVTGAGLVAGVAGTSRLKAVINAGAGVRPTAERQGLALALEQAFAAHGLQADIELAPAVDFEAAVRRAATGPWRAVAVGGGDGSLGSAARILSRMRKPMAVLPMGTMNYFARLLNIPLDLDGATAVIAAGNLGPVDAVEVNGRFFVSHCTLGIHPSFVSERIRLQHGRGWFKPLAMVWALLKSLVRYTVLRVEIVHDGRRESLRTPFVMVGNSLSALNPLAFRTRCAALDDGLMALIIGRRLGRLGLVASAARTFLGRLDPERDFRLLHLPECVVHVDRKLVSVTLDGELDRLAPPLRFRILPGALTMLLPDAATVAPGREPCLMKPGDDQEERP